MMPRINLYYLLLCLSIVTSCGDDNSKTSNSEDNSPAQEDSQNQKNVQTADNYINDNSPSNLENNPKEYHYKLSDSPVASQESYRGYIGSNAVSLNLSIHEDGKVSGTYVYDKYQKPILIIGEKYYDEYFQANNYSLEEWVDTNTISGVWFVYDDFGEGLIGDWSNPTSEDEYNIALLDTSSTKYLNPNDLMIFNSKDEADHFHSVHKFNNQHCLGIDMIIVPNNGYGGWLPNGLAVYSNDYSLLDGNGEGEVIVHKGTVSYESELIYENSDKMVIIDESMHILHDSPSGSNKGIGAFGLNRNKEDEWEVRIMGKDEFFCKLTDLEALDYNLEGDAYYLINYIKERLDPSRKFNDFEPLQLFKSPNENSEVLEGYTYTSERYFIIEDVEYIKNECWLKVNVMSNLPNAPHNSKEHGKLETNGWIKLYNDLDSGERILSLTYHGEGC
jgi:hypothetical protein